MKSKKDKKVDTFPKVLLATILLSTGIMFVVDVVLDQNAHSTQLFHLSIAAIILDAIGFILILYSIEVIVNIVQIAVLQKLGKPQNIKAKSNNR